MKLTQIEADKLVYVATLDSQMGHQRFGQALWNILPKEVADSHLGGDNDFFYWTDKFKVMSIFYKYYVEEL